MLCFYPRFESVLVIFLEGSADDDDIVHNLKSVNNNHSHHYQYHQNKPILNNQKFWGSINNS